MRHRFVRLTPAFLGCLLLAPGSLGQTRPARAQDRPLVEVAPSVVNGARRARDEASAPRPGAAERPALQRSPGRSLEDLRRDLERIEAGERAGAGVAPARERARAEEKASASSTSSHTRRVVVRNGRVIVDEETRDGRPVAPSPRALGPRPGVGQMPDAEAMLRRLEQELFRDLPDLRGLPAGGGGSHASRSHTRRVVVRNGKTIVDEETVDGRPVRPGAAPPVAAPPVADDRLGELLRQMERELVRDTERDAASDRTRTNRVQRSRDGRR